MKIRETPMGVSQWKEYGKKYGYWKHFVDELNKIFPDWNCVCEKPKPDGYYCVGEHEGRYQRCKICDKRLWD